MYYKKIYHRATLTYQGKPGIFLRSQFALRPDSLSRHHMILEQIGGMRLRIANFEIELFDVVIYKQFCKLDLRISKQTWATLGIACLNCSCHSVACSSATFVRQFRASVVSCTRSTRFRTFSEVPFAPLAICVYFESK